MQTTPFDAPPLSQLVYRLLGPVIVWLLVSWVVTDLLYPGYWLARPSRISAVAFDPDGWIRLYRDLAANLNHPPGICRADAELRDVESDLCQEFKTLLWERKVLAFTPWVGLWVFLLLRFWIFISYYQHAAARIRKGQYKFEGQLLPATKSSSFDRFYCLIPVRVLLPNQKILIASLGTQSSWGSRGKGRVKAKKGQAVQVYEMGNPFFGKRYLAVPDLSHVAIVRGS